MDFHAQICLGMSLVQRDVFQDARLCPVIARSLRSDDCSRVNVALRVAIAGGQLNDFAYSLYVLAFVTLHSMTVHSVHHRGSTTAASDSTGRCQHIWPTYAVIG